MISHGVTSFLCFVAVASALPAQSVDSSNLGAQQSSFGAGFGPGGYSASRTNELTGSQNQPAFAQGFEAGQSPGFGASASFPQQFGPGQVDSAAPASSQFGSPQGQSSGFGALGNFPQQFGPGQVDSAAPASSQFGSPQGQSSGFGASGNFPQQFGPGQVDSAAPASSQFGSPQGQSSGFGASGNFPQQFGPGQVDSAAPASAQFGSPQQGQSSGFGASGNFPQQFGPGQVDSAAPASSQFGSPQGQSSGFGASGNFPQQFGPGQVDSPVPVSSQFKSPQQEQSAPVQHVSYGVDIPAAGPLPVFSEGSKHTLVDLSQIDFSKAFRSSGFKEYVTIGDASGEVEVYRLVGVAPTSAVQGGAAVTYSANVGVSVPIYREVEDEHEIQIAPQPTAYNAGSQGPINVRAESAIVDGNFVVILED